MNRSSNRPHEAPLPDPLGYFLTWTTYGTWLPGDERGWVKCLGGFQCPQPLLELESMARMTEDACRLDLDDRALVTATIHDHCRIRGWELFAVNCRSNHVHVVVAANCAPRLIREQLKAWSTRRLKERSEAHRRNWWSERGSIRYLADDESLQAAVAYVRDGQDKRPAPH